MKRFIIVPLSSAHDLRDAGIRYGMLKASQYASGVVLVLCGALALWADTIHHELIYRLSTAVALTLGVMFYLCAKQLDFPHFVRVSLEDLETMRGLGLSSSVLKDTEEAILHGSMEEHAAIRETATILERIGLATRK